MYSFSSFRRRSDILGNGKLRNSFSKAFIDDPTENKKNTVATLKYQISKMDIVTKPSSSTLLDQKFARKKKEKMNAIESWNNTMKQPPKYILCTIN